MILVLATNHMGVQYPADVLAVSERERYFIRYSSILVCDSTPEAAPLWWRQYWCYDGPVSNDSRTNYSTVLKKIEDHLSQWPCLNS